MAAFRPFPSIHDKTSDNKKIWTHFYLKPKQLNPLTSFTTDSAKKDCNGGAYQVRSTTPQAGAEAPWKTLGCLSVSDYQPLDVFSVTAEDSATASWSEADEMCELYIRLKEIELCDMIGDKPGIPKCKHTDNNYLLLLEN